jgi:serine/threonine protein kinase
MWDGKIDLWSFGCLLAELVLGAPVFHAPSVESVLASHVRTASAPAQRAHPCTHAHAASAGRVRAIPLDPSQTLAPAATATATATATAIATAIATTIAPSSLAPCALRWRC